MSDNDGTFSILQEDDKKYFEGVINKYCNTSAVLEKLIETENAIDGVYDLLNSEVDASVETITEERLSSLEFKMDTLLKELASIKNSISGNIVDRVNNNTDTSMKYILDSVLSVERSISKLITEQNELKLNFYIRINELEKKLEQHKSISEEVDTTLGSKIDKMHNSLVDMIEDSFEDAHSDIGDISDIVIGQAAAIVDNSSARLTKELDKRKYVTKDYIDLVRNDLADKIDALNKNIYKGFNDISNSIDLVRSELKFDYLDKFITDSTNKILYSLDENKQSLLKMQAEDKTYFDDYFNDISVSVDKIMDLLNDKSTETRIADKTHFDAVAGAMSEIKNGLSMISDINISVSGIKESIDGLSEDVGELTKTINKNVITKELKKSIDSALDDVKDSVNDLSEDMVELTLSINNNFTNKELKEKVNKLETGFDNVIKMLGSG